MLEGRRTFGNIMKYIMMGTSSNFGNMFSMAGASLFLPFLPMLPTQILLNNILYDISEVPIPLDEVDAEDIRTPARTGHEVHPQLHARDRADQLAVRLPDLLRHAGRVAGRREAVSDRLVRRVAVHPGAGDLHHPHARQSVEEPCPPAADGDLARRGGLAVLLPFTPIGTYFGFVPPPAKFYLILGAMVLVYLFVVELAKQGFYRWSAAGRPRRSARRRW